MSSTLRIESSRANGAKSRGPVTPEGKKKSAANSAHSTGPVTPEGKARSSMNALRYGMLAESIVLPNESDEEFKKKLAALEAELRPETEIERGYVKTMTLSDWRRDRAICLEREQLAMEIRHQQQADLTSFIQSDSDTEESSAGVTPAEVNPMECNALAFRAVVDQSRAHEYLNRFENRHDRQYNRALRNFLNYRNERRKQGKIDAKNADSNRT